MAALDKRGLAKSVSAKGTFYLIGFQRGPGGAHEPPTPNKPVPKGASATEWLRIYQEHPSSADASSLVGKNCRFEVSKGAVRDFLAEGEPVCALRDGLVALGWVPRIAVSRRREALKAILRAAQEDTEGRVLVDAAAAVAAVLRDPFIALEVDAEDLAIGVEAAAGLALAAGVSLPGIAASAAKHAVRAAEASSGHVCVPAAGYPRMVSASLGVHKNLFPPGVIVEAVSKCVEKGDLVASGGMIYRRAMFEAEEYIRGFLEYRRVSTAQKASKDTSAPDKPGMPDNPDNPDTPDTRAFDPQTGAPGPPRAGETGEVGEAGEVGEVGEANEAEEYSEYMDYSDYSDDSDYQDELENRGTLENLEETLRSAKAACSLSAEQKAAVDAAVSCFGATGVMVLTGGAGVGKSRTVGAVVETLGARRVLLCAPTGKAARRLEKSVETIVGLGAGPTGMTVHRLLGIGCPSALVSKRDLRTRAAAGDSPYPSGEEVLGDGQLLVVDEASMLDIRLARRICLAASRHRLSLLFVGDPNQLPSVGPGRVLDDLAEWAAGAGALRGLTEIRRQGGASPIAALGRAVVEGDLEACERLLGRRAPGNASAEEASDSASAAEAQTNASAGVAPPFPELVLIEPGPEGGLAEAVEAYAAAGGLAPENFGSVQALSGRREGPSSTDEINTACVLSMDPERTLTAWGAPRIVSGDKVVVTANAAGGGGASCCSGSAASAVPARNGDIGLLKGWMPGGMAVVEMSDDGGGCRGPAASSTVVASKSSDVGHGHAVTVHKFQGCEADTVVFAIHRAHSRMLYSNLVYTAVTRAKRRLVIVGKLGVFLGAVSTQAPERHSGGFVGGRRV